MIDGGAPNACNLCHLDRSLAWTLRELARGWGRALRPKAGWKRLYGERLERPVGRVWLDSPDANVRVMAAAAYARSPRARAALPWLIDKLDDPIAYYRMWMLFAIEDALGRRVRRGEYDPHAAPGVRAVSAARLRAGMTKPTER